MTTPRQGADAASVPDLMIERLARGELSATEAAAVRGALGERLEARMAAIAEDDAALLARLPPSRVAATVRRRIEGTVASRPATSWWIPMTTLAAASLAVWCAVRAPEPAAEFDGGAGIVAPPADGALDPGSDEVVRIKGDAAFTIDRMAAAGPERVGDGTAVRVGDRLQLQYRAGEQESGAIVSIDGRGVATLHFPADVADSPRLEPGGVVALDHSYELDDAPGFERFFFVTVPAGVRLDVASVLGAARELAASADAERGALRVPPAYEVTSLTLDKSNARR